LTRSSAPSACGHAPDLPPKSVANRSRKGYTDATLPTAETIGTKLNALAYYLQRRAKSRPQKSLTNRRHLRPASGGSIAAPMRDTSVPWISLDAKSDGRRAFRPWRKRSPQPLQPITIFVRRLVDPSGNLAADASELCSCNGITSKVTSDCLAGLRGALVGGGAPICPHITMCWSLIR